MFKIDRLCDCLPLLLMAIICWRSMRNATQKKKCKEKQKQMNFIRKRKRFRLSLIIKTSSLAVVKKKQNRLTIGQKHISWWLTYLYYDKYIFVCIYIKKNCCCLLLNVKYLCCDRFRHTVLCFVLLLAGWLLLCCTPSCCHCVLILIS